MPPQGLQSVAMNAAKKMPVIKEGFNFFVIKAKIRTIMGGVTTSQEFVIERVPIFLFSDKRSRTVYTFWRRNKQYGP
jgi:hypothetical protein